MHYGHIIFDFDSTLIQFESLEMILAKALEAYPDKIKKIADLTTKGMNGQMPFKEALYKRLEIAKPTKKAINAFINQYCPGALTLGMKGLIQRLHQQGGMVHVISGGFKEVILPFTRYLNIPDENVHALVLLWDDNCKLVGVDETNGFADSKVKGMEKLGGQLQGRSVIVGDGMTDYQLYHKRLVGDFVAYAEHVKRDEVIALAPHVASSVTDLYRLFDLPVLNE
ncbi:HAD-IB family phosphatase [Facilibium subflavum]|uniref:HAD-IB family phosphatase n=1 Tax=Facilibium subflavum TaxID=2219058 RepID=UPI000E64AB41|nr:HAD-IB family phosphatase [Facilibium subflavum]